MSDPSTTQAARLAIGHIREAWPHLESAKDATLGRVPPQPRDLTPAARRTLNELLRAERGERLTNQRQGLIPRLAAPTPARLAVVDVEQHVRETVNDLSWLAASNLRQIAGHLAGAHDAARLDGIPVHPTGARHIEPYLDYLADVLDLADLDEPALVDEQFTHRAAAELATAARRLTATLQLDESWIPVRHRRCPACGQRSLRAYLGSPHVREWTITCTGTRPACICDGIDCPCKRPGRRPATRHIWSAAQLRHLGRIAPAA